MSEPFVEIVAQAVNQLYELAQKYRDRWDDFGGRQLKIEVGAILDPVMNALEAARGVVPSAPSPAAIEAALREGKLRRLSAHEVQNESMLEAQIAASVRAAYAVDRGLSSAAAPLETK